MGDLVFWGRKYGDYNLSSHGNQRIQADAWGVNPGVGWYVTTPNPFSPNGRQIQAAGPIYNTEGGKRSRLQHSRAGWPESVAHSDTRSIG